MASLGSPGAWACAAIVVLALAFKLQSDLWGAYLESLGISSIPSMYGDFFLARSAFGIAVVAVGVAGIVGARLLPVEGLSGEGVERDPVEAALLLTLLLLLFPVVLAVDLMHGGMTDRYVLAAILGVALAMACAMTLARGKIVLLFAVFVLSSVAICELSFWRSAHSLRLNNPAPSAEAAIQKAGHPDLPVVVSDGVAYLQLAYYATPEWKKRLVFLQDPEKALKYSGRDSLDKLLANLCPYAPIQVDALSEYVAAHPTFLLYVEEPGTGQGWLQTYFPEQASSVQSLVVEENRKVYLVTMR